MAQEQQLREAIKAFELGDEIIEVIGDYGTGHVNDTYVVKVDTEGTIHDFIVQRINTFVFKSPSKLMANIINVTDFMRHELEERNEPTERAVLEFQKTGDGNYYFTDSIGDTWRTYRFIDKSTTYNRADTKDLFGKSGEAFGRFMLLLSDYPAEELHETIMNFHNTVSRYGDFKRAVEEDAKDRLKLVESEVAFILEREEPAGSLVRQLEANELPLRVTHNDTKLNNVLFDEDTGEVLCVIDLDTVMPGLAAYDFGDAIRFGASTASEDERDLSKVQLDLDYYEAYTAGYLKVAAEVLTAKEIESLPWGAYIMTLEVGLRFLQDYLMGDVYFKVVGPEDNLHRARTQLKLLEEIEANFERMQEITQKIATDLLA